MINKEKFRFYKIHESVVGEDFEIGDGYGILEISENEIQEKIDMTGYYYINADGEKITTDEEFWKMEEIKKEKFYFQEDDEEISWDGAFVDLIFEHWNGRNWEKIWLDHAGMRSGEVEDVTDEIGTLERIAYEVIDGALSFCKKAYKDDKGNYYYMNFSYCNDTLDFYQLTDLETLKGIFEDLE